MRYPCFALAGALLAASLVSGQQPAQPPAAPPLDPTRSQLDALLVEWENKMKSLETVSAEVVREKEDKVFRTKEIFEGRARYMRPNLALLELHMRDRPTIIERYIFSGTYLYEYNRDNREIRIHELPPPKPGQVADDNFLSFLFGMKAEEAKRRYDLRLVGDGTDKYYYYVEILPRFAADKADFQKAQLALTKSTLLPRMLTFTEPNGNRITWDIPALQTGLRLDRNEFTQPQLPPGWKFRRMPRANDVPNPDPGDMRPRVVRPKT